MSKIINPFTSYIPTGDVVPVAVSALTEVFVARLLPPGSDQDRYRAYLTVCAAAGSAHTTNPAFWKSYVATYTLTAFPGLQSNAGVMSGVQVAIVADPACRALDKYAAMLKVKDFSAEGMRTVSESTVYLIGQLFPGYESCPGAPAFDGVYDSSLIRPLYAHYSFVVWLAGKTITDQNRESIEKARPKAVIAKYRLSLGEDGEDTVTLLNGEGKLSPAAHDGINRAWMEMSAFRATALKEVLLATVVGTQITHEVMNVTTSLLAFSGLSHAMFCRMLLDTEPWVETYPPLAAAAAAYRASERILLDREPILRPYVKVLYQDRAKIFPRKDLIALIECAIDSKRVPGSSMMNYYSDPNYQSVVAMFRQERQRRLAAAEGATVVASTPAAPLPGTTPPAPEGSAPVQREADLGMQEDDLEETEEEEPAPAPPQGIVIQPSEAELAPPAPPAPESPTVTQPASKLPGPSHKKKGGRKTATGLSAA